MLVTQLGRRRSPVSRIFGIINTILFRIVDARDQPDITDLAVHLRLRTPTLATLLKWVDAPDRDIQLILGHAKITTTQEIYEHDDMDSRRQWLGQLGKLLHGGDQNRPDSSSDRDSAMSMNNTGRGLAQNDATKFGCQVWLSKPSLVEQLMRIRGDINKPATGVDGAGLRDKFIGDPTEPELEHSMARFSTNE